MNLHRIWNLMVSPGQCEHAREQEMWQMRGNPYGSAEVRIGVNFVIHDSAGWWAYLALKSSAVSLVLSICETSLEFSALVHKI